MKVTNISIYIYNIYSSIYSYISSNVRLCVQKCTEYKLYQYLLFRSKYFYMLHLKLGYVHLISTKERLEALEDNVSKEIAISTRYQLELMDTSATPKVDSSLEEDLDYIENNIAIRLPSGMKIVRKVDLPTNLEILDLEELENDIIRKMGDGQDKVVSQDTDSYEREVDTPIQTYAGRGSVFDEPCV